MHEKLRELLEQLRLAGMAACLDRELQRAEREAIPVADVLYRLALEEARVRQEKSLANRLKQAKMPWDWTLESFPFARAARGQSDPDDVACRYGLCTPRREPGVHRPARYR